MCIRDSQETAIRNGLGYVRNIISPHDAQSLQNVSIRAVGRSFSPMPQETADNQRLSPGFTLIDSHCHLDFPDFAAELDAVIARRERHGKPVSQHWGARDLAS